MRILACVLVAAVAVGCAPRIVPVPVVTVPRYPDFVRPAVPTELAENPAAPNHERAWGFLQAGDLKNAELEVGLALRATPGFYPTEAAAGYLELARNAPEAALPRFDAALMTRPDYVAALIGRGQALESLDRDDEAIGAFESAIAA